MAGENRTIELFLSRSVGFLKKLCRIFEIISNTFWNILLNTIIALQPCEIYTCSTKLEILVEKMWNLTNWDTILKWKNSNVWNSRPFSDRRDTIYGLTNSYGAKFSNIMWVQFVFSSYHLLTGRSIFSSTWIKDHLKIRAIIWCCSKFLYLIRRIHPNAFNVRL